MAPSSPIFPIGHNRIKIHRNLPRTYGRIQPQSGRLDRAQKIQPQLHRARRRSGSDPTAPSAGASRGLGLGPGDAEGAGRGEKERGERARGYVRSGYEDWWKWFRFRSCRVEETLRPPKLVHLHTRKGPPVLSGAGPTRIDCGVLRVRRCRGTRGALSVRTENSRKVKRMGRSLVAPADSWRMSAGVCGQPWSFFF